MSEAALLFSENELKLLREKYAKLTDLEFDAFISAAKRYRLNPLANQIYARLQPQTDRNPRAVTYMTQIDGYRLIADRTGAYAGNDDPRYDNEKDPKRATVTVHKIVAGQRCAFEASARWDQYFPGDRQGFMWRKMPHLMLGKCAESLALRKAFPAELSGLYTVEEMEQAETAPHESKAPESKEAETKRSPTVPEQIAAQTTAPGLSTLLLDWVGKWPVAKFEDFWRKTMPYIIRHVQGAGWAEDQIASINAVLAGVRKGILDNDSQQAFGGDPAAATTPAATPATPPAEKPTADASKAPSLERIAGWLDQLETAADLQNALVSIDSSPKLADLRSNPTRVLEVLRHAFNLTQDRVAVKDWTDEQGQTLADELSALETKYDLSQQAAAQFPGSET